MQSPYLFAPSRGKLPYAETIKAPPVPQQQFYSSAQPMAYSIPVLLTLIGEGTKLEPRRERQRARTPLVELLEW